MLTEYPIYERSTRETDPSTSLYTWAGEKTESVESLPSPRYLEGLEENLRPRWQLLKQAHMSHWFV